MPWRFSFNGTFQQGCQQNAVPPSLLALVKMIQEGPNIECQSNLEDGTSSRTLSALSIPQLLVFHSVKHVHKSHEQSGSRIRHTRERETPLPVYIALKLHGLTRKRNLVDVFYCLGMCVSYDRLLQLTSDMSNGICKQFETENVVCPPKMCHGLYTTSAVDNIDHNPSSTSHDSFHGTCISIMQHPSCGSTGIDRGVVLINQDTTSSSTKTVAHLPTFYTSVPPAAFKDKGIHCSSSKWDLMSSNLLMSSKATEEEKQWWLQPWRKTN